jgi:hypothetical protein
MSIDVVGIFNEYFSVDHFNSAIDIFSVFTLSALKDELRNNFLVISGPIIPGIACCSNHDGYIYVKQMDVHPSVTFFFSMCNATSSKIILFFHSSIYPAIRHFR